MKISNLQKNKIKQFIKTLRKKKKGTRNILFKLGLFNIGLMFPLEYLLLREAIGLDSFIDLGCGPHSFTAILPDDIDSVGIDIFDEYLEESKKREIHKRYIKGDLKTLNLKDKTFDAAILLDVIEHLEREQGLNLLHRAEKWARKKILIYTPNEFTDQYPYDKNPYQLHKSGWNVKDFKDLGYKVYGLKGLRQFEKFSKGKGKLLKLFVSILMKFSQIYTYFFPFHARRLFCVKEIQNPECHANEVS